MTAWTTVRQWLGPHGVLVRFVPERRLAVAVAIAAPLWLLPGTAGTIAGGFTVAAILLCAIVDMIGLPSRDALVVTRETAPTVGIGDRADGTYTILSNWPRALEVRLFDRLPAAVMGGVGVADVRVPKFGSAPIPFNVTGMARGRWKLGPVGARVTTRLGLVGARFAVGMADDLLVVPSVRGVRRFRLLAMQHRLDVVGVRELRRRGEGQAFDRLRDYVVGDDPRHVDWKATAHKGKLITREFTVERSQAVFTLIDAGRGMTQLAGDISRFERALSSALVLTDIAVNAGDRVGTLVFDDAIRAFVPAVRSRGALQAVRNALVPVTATPREPDYATAFRFLASHQRKRALIVFFTDVIDVRASQSLFAYVSRSAARHLVIVVALRNDAIFAAALPRTAGNAALLYESAAAEELILAREDALERMRRTGVVVIDVSPLMMTPSVVNKYLEVKARGAL